MTISKGLRTRLEIMQKKMAARGEEVSMDELIQAHERGISGKEAQVLDGLLEEAKGRLQSAVNAGKESSLIDPDK